MWPGWSAQPLCAMLRPEIQMSLYMLFLPDYSSFLVPRRPPLLLLLPYSCTVQDTILEWLLGWYKEDHSLGEILTVISFCLSDPPSLLKRRLFKPVIFIKIQAEVVPQPYGEVSKLISYEFHHPLVDSAGVRGGLLPPGHKAFLSTSPFPGANL